MVIAYGQCVADVNRSSNANILKAEYYETVPCKILKAIESFIYSGIIHYAFFSLNVRAKQCSGYLESVCWLY